MAPDPPEVCVIEVRTIHPVATYNAQQRERAIQIAAALNRGRFVLIARPDQT